MKMRECPHKVHASAAHVGGFETEDEGAQYLEFASAGFGAMVRMCYWSVSWKMWRYRE